MANELQVVVNQIPGQISWNFEQLKGTLGAMMSEYQGMVYTDDNIAGAKTDLAALRKLRESVEKQRKAIKDRCLEPYAVIEGQARELTSLIDKPIAAINGQVKAYEQSKKDEKQKTIRAYMTDAFKGIPEEIVPVLVAKTYNSRWENATCAKKVWAEAITAARDRTLAELKILEGIDDDFKDTVMKVYRQNLVLAEALNKAKELRTQKEAILERERKRAEEAEARAAAAGAAKRMAPVIQTVSSEPAPPPAPAPQATATAIPNKEHTPAPAPAVNGGPASGESQGVELWEIVLRLRGTKEQLNKVAAYAKHIGASYRMEGKKCLN